MVEPTRSLSDFFPDNQTLLPAIVQEPQYGKVLMLGYMNREALERTIETRQVTFFSRSRGRLWTKGESSGHFLVLEEIRWDCDQDTFLILANPVGPTCHTGTDSCFDGRILFRKDYAPAFETLTNLQKLIHDRWSENPETSYVARLLTGPKGQLLKKLVEEAGETMASVFEERPEAIRSEMADLLFHLFVTMERAGITWSGILQILEKRTGKSGILEKQERPGKNTSSAPEEP